MIDPTVYIAKGAAVLGDVEIGARSSIWYNSVLRADMAPIRVGECTNIQDLSLLHVDEGLACILGSRVSVGHRVILHGCTVEDECLIGMGAILLNDVVLGRGSVVGAGALLTEGTVIPPGSLVLGMPGRVVRPVDARLRGDIDFAWRHYLEQAERHRRGEVRMHPPSANGAPTPP